VARHVAPPARFHDVANRARRTGMTRQSRHFTVRRNTSDRNLADNQEHAISKREFHAFVVLSCESAINN
jgi:hypothetical protein